MRLLLVEDSRRLQRWLGAGLRRAGHAVDVAGDGEDGLQLALTNRYDVIVLDLMLPSLDGYTVLEKLRAEGDEEDAAHVLILTARDTVEDKLRGFELGADDYLVKPFDLQELLARIQALVRRRHGRSSPRITLGALTIDTAARRVFRDGVPLALTAREYVLLEYLALRRGQVVARGDIEACLFDGRNEPTSNAVDAAIAALRRRIDVPGEPSVIQTHRGQGYLLRGPGE
jgi:DNA-binding response OmpR family regulator